MWYQIKSYLNFLLKSSNQHGVHSPFVYDLITNCFYDKNNYPAYQKIKEFRIDLTQNKDSIEIIDFGAGSRVFKSNQRKVTAIVKNAGIPFKRQKLLYRITNYFKPKTILELGTSLGLGTAAMAFTDYSNEITTVEGCHNTTEVSKLMFKKYQLKNIQLQNSTFDKFFKKQPSKLFDMVYIDGAHDKKSTLQNFEYLMNHIHNGSVLIFDDIYWSLEMTEAWNIIKEHPKVSVSIDTFYWGLVFFRKEQRKQHFSIRL